MFFGLLTYLIDLTKLSILFSLNQANKGVCHFSIYFSILSSSKLFFVKCQDVLVNEKQNDFFRTKHIPAISKLLPLGLSYDRRYILKFHLLFLYYLLIFNSRLYIHPCKYKQKYTLCFKKECNILHLCDNYC